MDTKLPLLTIERLAKNQGEMEILCGQISARDLSEGYTDDDDNYFHPILKRLGSEMLFICIL